VEGLKLNYFGLVFFFLIGFLFHDLHINEWIEGLKVVSLKLDMINWAEPLNLDLTYI
jgi:hypothetical protein